MDERDFEQHNTVKLTGCPFLDDGEETDVDAVLAPLIRQVWRLDISTYQCCHEEWPGLASITFPGTDEAMDFLIVAQEDYRTELERWDEGEEGEHAIALRLLVVFPTADIPKLVARFAGVERDDEGDIVPCRRNGRA